MRIVLIGGHLAPALASIEELKGEEIFYIGRKYTFEGDKAISLEYSEITNLNIPFFPISTARLQRKFTRHTLVSFLKFPAGFFQSLVILKKIKPDVVLGFGGYVSIPVIIAASILKIPVVIHEQTLEAGFANGLISNFAKKVCISWQSSGKYFPKQKTVLTGNPIRQEIISIKKTKKIINKKPVIYITGGSSGSHAINLLVEQSIVQSLKNYSVIHQTGDAREFSDFQRLEKLSNENYIVKKFISPTDVAKILAKADLIVGRAGINTVTELIYLEKPALLIPLPFSQKNEQLKNAKFLKEVGLGELIEQNYLSKETFVSMIFTIIQNAKNYRLKENVLIENATQNLVRVVKDVAKKKAS